jgi:hypothetical protein
MKVECDTCGWRGTDEDILTSHNPFEPDEEIDGCPKCHCIDTLLTVCDAPGCVNTLYKGWPYQDGYSTKCVLHAPCEDFKWLPF